MKNPLTQRIPSNHTIRRALIKKSSQDLEAWARRYEAATALAEAEKALANHDCQGRCRRR